MRTLLGIFVSVVTLTAAGELSNRRAPGFSLPDMVSMQQHDPQDYRGRILLVEVMQTTCPHCLKFSGILEEVVTKYAGRVAVLSITNPPDNMATVRQFAAQHKITVPILYDCGQVAASYLKVGPSNPTVNIPHLFVIDAQGMIRADFSYGPLTKEIFEGQGLFAELDRMMTPSRTLPPKR